MLFCCLRRNVEASCPKHFVVCLQRILLPAMSVTNLPRPGGAACITVGGCTVDNTRWSHILVGNRDLCLPHLYSTARHGGPRRNITIRFGMEKLEWWWLLFFLDPSSKILRDRYTRLLLCIIIKQENNEWRIVKDQLLGHFTKLLSSRDGCGVSY